MNMPMSRQHVKMKYGRSPAERHTQMTVLLSVSQKK